MFVFELVGGPDKSLPEVFQLISGGPMVVISLVNRLKVHVI